VASGFAFGVTVAASGFAFGVSGWDVDGATFGTASLRAVSERDGLLGTTEEADVEVVVAVVFSIVIC
jgi:hypothetical protein